MEPQAQPFGFESFAVDSIKTPFSIRVLPAPGSNFGPIESSTSGGQQGGVELEAATQKENNSKGRPSCQATAKILKTICQGDSFCPLWKRQLEMDG